MKNLILILIIMCIAGCATVPPYTGPSFPLLVQDSGVHHRVETGQTLWSISKLYGVDIDDILHLNHLPEDAAIEIGQVLIIPNRASVQNNIPVKSSGDDFIWPLRGRVISGFGATYHNLINKGINIQAPAGSEILSTRSGRVVFYANSFGNYGKTIIIDHGDGLRSVYSRFSEIFVKPGENVPRGTLVGRLGSTVRDKNSYLHFEIRKGALSQNPLFYLS